MSTKQTHDLDYLRQKRQAVLDELHSDSHYDQTAAIAYGDRDPLDVPLATCDHCGCKPQIEEASQHPVRWTVVCRCGRRSKPNRPRPWQAALEWNNVNLTGHEYRGLPLFGLRHLSPKQAHERMKGIRRNLELRKALNGLTLEIHRRSGQLNPPGRGYQERIEAYLQWSMWALRLTKVAIQRQYAANSGAEAARRVG